MSAIESAAVLNGRYHVLRPVGRGGMGAVYEAVDLRLRNTVAVKKMTAEGPEARRAFEREGRLLAMLRHRALPVVIDYFIEDSSCFLVMQFIEGEDLAALVRRKGACPDKDVQRWAAEVLAALVYLHGLDTPVIHRDIKPANIKLTPRGDIVLLDFGLAKGAPDSETRPADDDQSIYGFTPNYAPPEQLQFQGTDARSDLYTLGATLHHLMMGVAPPSAVDRSAAIGLGRPDPLIGSTSSATVSEPFAAVLRRAMAIDPAARFASAEDMLRALTSPAPGNDTEPARPHALFSSPPQVRPSTRARRLDAATPSRAELDRAVDLLVQVRFADSPLLGLEDWPTRRKPDRIEQASEPVTIEHPVDPATGRFLPARLRIKLVAPDFEIRGASEQLIDVTPDEYSQRVAFLMTPRRIGYSRVNVEVYAADTVYLGAIAIESEVVAEGVQQAPLCTADLVLNVTAKEPLLAAPPVAMRPIPTDSDESTAIGLPPPKVAPDPVSSRVARQVKPGIHLTDDVEDSDRAPSPERIPTVAFGTAAAPIRPSASFDPPTTTSRVPPALPLQPPPAPPRSSSRIRTAALALSAAAVLMIAIQVQQSLNTSTQLSAPPAAPTTPESQTAPPSSAGGGPPPDPSVAPPPVATATPAPPPPAAPGPLPKASPPPRPSAPVTSPPAAAPPVSSATRPPAPPSTAPAGVPSSSHPGVTLRVVSIERVRSGVVRVRVRITNNSASAVSVGVARARTRLAVERATSYQVVNPGDAADSAGTVAAGRSIEQSIDFAVPDRIGGSLRLTLAPAAPDAARFPPFPVVVQNR